VIAAAPAPTRVPGNADRKEALAGVIRQQAIIPAKNIVYNAQLPPGVDMVLDFPRRGGPTAPQVPHDPRVLGMRQEGTLQVQPTAPSRWQGLRNPSGCALDSRAAHVSVRGGDAPVTSMRSLRGTAGTVRVVTSHAPSARAALASTTSLRASAVSRSRVQCTASSHVPDKRQFPVVSSQPAGRFATAHQATLPTTTSSHKPDKRHFAGNASQPPGKFATAHQATLQTTSSHKPDKRHFAGSASQPPGRFATAHQAALQTTSSHNPDKRHFAGNASQPPGRFATAHQAPVQATASSQNSKKRHSESTAAQPPAKIPAAHQTFFPMVQTSHVEGTRKLSAATSQAPTTRFGSRTSFLEARSSHAPSTRKSVADLVLPPSTRLSDRSGVSAGVTDHSSKARDPLLLVPNLLGARVLPSSATTTAPSARPASDRELASAPASAPSTLRRVNGGLTGVTESGRPDADRELASAPASAPSTLRRVNGGLTGVTESGRPEADRVIAGLGAPSAKVPGGGAASTSVVPQRETRTGAVGAPVARWTVPASTKQTAANQATLSGQPDKPRPLVLAGGGAPSTRILKGTGAESRLSEKAARSSTVSLGNVGVAGKVPVPERNSVPELVTEARARETVPLCGGSASSGAGARRGVRAVEIEHDAGRSTRTDESHVSGPSPQVNPLKRSAPLVCEVGKSERESDTSALAPQAKRMRSSNPMPLGSASHCARS